MLAAATAPALAPDPEACQTLRHVALFTQDMSGGGAFTTVFASYARALARSGVRKIDLVTVRGDPARSEIPFPDRSRAVPLGGGGAGGAVLPLARYLEREQPDVLISGPIVPNLAACLARRLARRWRGRLVLSHHHPLDLARRQTWKNSPTLVRLLYPTADASFAVSPGVREDAVRVARTDPRRTACIPVPVPPAGAGGAPPPHPWLRPDGRERPLFLTVGRLEPVKNLSLLLEGFRRAAGVSGGRLLVVGEGSAESGLPGAIRAAGLGDRVALTGRVPSTLPYYRGADVFVLTSDEEGYGLVLLEAMREGVPVISTDALGSGPRFLLDGGAAGRLIPRNDPCALAGAMIELSAADRRDVLRAAASRRLAALSPERIGAQLTRFLSDGRAVGTGLAAR
ncbi:MAG TPA: glycosyltransferase [Geminicoccaceae bacterium]